MTIYIDGSHTFCTTRNTGVERVVRKLTLNLESISKEQTGVSVKRVIHYSGRFAILTKDAEKDLAEIAFFESNAAAMLPGFASRLLENSKKLIPSRRWRKLVSPEPSHLGIYKIPFALRKNYLMRKRFGYSKAVQWKAEDQLVLPDAYWTKRNIWSSVNQVRKIGVKVTTILYDLIPLTHIEFVGEKRSIKFKQYINDMLKNSDQIMTISEFAKSELIEYIKKSMGGCNRVCSKIDSFTLGADIQGADGEVREEVKAYFGMNKSGGDRRPYIVVGSIDPRKNHLQVIRAFEHLKCNGSPRRLCFIGRAGGLSGNTLQAMESSSIYPDLLQHFSDLSDSELQYAYRNCEAVIMASVVEGFGLPIVEALWNGVTLLASDIPIHREVSGDQCRFFTLHDPIALAKCVLDAEGNVERAVARCTPTSWKESAKEFLRVAKLSQIECNESAITIPLQEIRPS